MCIPTRALNAGQICVQRIIKTTDWIPLSPPKLHHHFYLSSRRSAANRRLIKQKPGESGMLFTAYLLILFAMADMIDGQTRYRSHRVITAHKNKTAA